MPIGKESRVVAVTTVNDYEDPYTVDNNGEDPRYALLLDNKSPWFGTDDSLYRFEDDTISQDP